MSEGAAPEAPPAAGQGSPRSSRPPETTIAETLREALRSWVARLSPASSGALPIFVGLAALALLFGSLDENFYTERNFVNLLLQTAGIATIAMGIVFVLLIAEIDLSVGFVSGVGAVIMTLLLRPEETNWPWWAAIAAALAATSAIGLLHGVIITKARRPVLRRHARRLPHLERCRPDPDHAGLELGHDPDPGRRRARNRERLPPGRAGAGSCSSASSPATRRSSWRRCGRESARGVSHRPLVLIALQLAGIGVIGALAVWYANKDRGVPGGRGDRRRVPRLLDVRRATGRGSAATSTPSAATPRRRGGRASTSTGSGSPCS